MLWINPGMCWVIAGHHTSGFGQDKVLTNDVKLDEPSLVCCLNKHWQIKVLHCLEQLRKHTLVQVKEGSSWQNIFGLTAEFWSVYKHKRFGHHGQ